MGDSDSLLQALSKVGGEYPAGDGALIEFDYTGADTGALNSHGKPYQVGKLNGRSRMFYPDDPAITVTIIHAIVENGHHLNAVQCA